MKSAVVSCWMMTQDGEQFFGDQEQYFEEPDQQNYFDPGWAQDQDWDEDYRNENQTCCQPIDYSYDGATTRVIFYFFASFM